MSLSRAKVSFLVFVISLGVVSALPIYPNGRLDRSDPVSVADPRVIALILDDDLKSIMEIVRKPRWGGLYGLLMRLGEGHAILEVSNSSNGNVVVTTGRVRGPLHGRGLKYVLTRTSSGWVLVQRSEWFA